MTAGAYRDDLRAAHAEIERLRAENQRLAAKKEKHGFFAMRSSRADFSDLRDDEPRDHRLRADTLVGAIICVVTLPLILPLGVLCVRHGDARMQGVIAGIRNGSMLMFLFVTVLTVGWPPQNIDVASGVAGLFLGLLALVGGFFWLIALLEPETMTCRHPFVRMPPKEPKEGIE